MKVIIAGSRGISDPQLIINAIYQSGFEIFEVVCGEASGVDTLGRLWAKDNYKTVKSFPAAWRVNGVYNWRAGFERNKDMALYADAAICVWDGKSGGTKDMIKHMRSLGKPCFVYQEDFVDLFC